MGLRGLNMSDYERSLESRNGNSRMSEQHYFAKSLAIQHGFKEFRGDPCKCGNTLRYSNNHGQCVVCSRKRSEASNRKIAMSDLVKRKKQLSNMAW